MGEPIRIVDLVHDLILLNNMQPDEDIKIEYTGIREGEKLFEEVLTAEEGVVATNHDKIFKARMVCLHDEKAIYHMIEDFQNRNGHTTKEEWKMIFKYYVNTFSPTIDTKRMDDIINNVKSYSIPLASQQD
jgi:FlaA1/EpsC-like NDP-sugar epimerase